MSPMNWFRTRPAHCTGRPTPQLGTRLGVQQLEAREVPTTDLLSALGVGNATGPTQAVDMAVDAAGNNYVTGFFYDTVDFDPANDSLGGADVLTSRGGGDIFVARYAPDGSLAWAKRMGGDYAVPDPAVNGYATDVGRDIAVDGAGNVYVAGEFRGTADFGPITRTSAGGDDGFVAKLDPAGTVQWANRWGTTIEDSGQGVGIDAAGNVYALGYRFTSPGTGNGHDVFKFSPTGTTVWAKWISTRSQPISADLAVDAAGNTFVAGRFQGTVDFDPNAGKRNVYSGPTSSSAGFVLKLTSAGNFGWVAPFVVSNGSAAAQSITLDTGGNVIVGGYYSGTVDFNPGGGTTYLPATGKAFITKLTAGGSLAWARALAGTGSTFVYGLAVDSAGSIYATGLFSGTVDFDPGAGTHSRTTAGGSDAYVLKLDANGNFGWAESFGSTGNDIGFGIGVDATGTVHLAGGYSGTVDFDPDPGVAFDLTNPPGGKTNMYLVRLRQN